jgi:hypothetical protein
VKQVQFIELIVMNLKTACAIFYSTFYMNWTTRKEDGKVYSFRVEVFFVTRVFDARIFASEYIR